MPTPEVAGPVVEREILMILRGLWTEEVEEEEEEGSGGGLQEWRDDGDDAMDELQAWLSD